MTTVDAWIEKLTDDECYELLAGHGLGRVAVVYGDTAPLVVPVNYVMDGRTVVFRSGYGMKLRGALARPTSFQVDSFDEAHRTGWSVLARGRAHEVFGRDVEHLGLQPWVPDDRFHWVRLDIYRITGRRIRRAEPPIT